MKNVWTEAGDVSNYLITFVLNCSGIVTYELKCY